MLSTVNIIKNLQYQCVNTHNICFLFRVIQLLLMYIFSFTSEEMRAIHIFKILKVVFHLHICYSYQPTLSETHSNGGAVVTLGQRTARLKNVK